LVSKNRDRLCIIADILKVANEGVGKTRIMFLANLSFKLLERYLKLTVNAGFVSVEDSSYVLTDVGREFLRNYRRFRRNRSRVEKAVGDLAREQDHLVSLIERAPLSDAVNSARVE
jgi:predicted transcriptional regulator